MKENLNLTRARIYPERCPDGRTLFTAELDIESTEGARFRFRFYIGLRSEPFRANTFRYAWDDGSGRKPHLAVLLRPQNSQKPLGGVDGKSKTYSAASRFAAKIAGAIENNWMKFDPSDRAVMLFRCAEAYVRACRFDEEKIWAELRQEEDWEEAHSDLPALERFCRRTEEIWEQALAHRALLLLSEQVRFSDLKLGQQDLHRADPWGVLLAPFSVTPPEEN